MKTFKATILAAATLMIATPSFAQGIKDTTASDTQSSNGSSRFTDQQNGQFPEKRQIPVGGAIQDAWTDAGPGAGILDVVNPMEEVTQVTLREGVVTIITLPPSVPMLDFWIGDGDNFSTQRCEKTPGCLAIWPTRPGFDTNLNLVTEGNRVISFYLRSETWNSKNIPHTLVRVGRGTPATMSARPQESGAAMGGTIDTKPPKEAIQPALAAEWTQSIEFDPLTMRHDLGWSGDVGSNAGQIDLKDAWRDKYFTYLDWGPNSDPTKWPVVWEVEDGVDIPARIRRSKDGRYLVIESPLGFYTLRFGEAVVCIRPIAAN